MFLLRRSKCFYCAEVNLCLCLYDVKAILHLYDVEISLCLYDVKATLHLYDDSKLMSLWRRRATYDEFRPKMKQNDGATS